MIIGLPVTTVIAQASPSPSPMPSPTTAAPAVTDPAVMARAKDWLHQIQTGKVDRSQLTDKMNAELTDATLTSVSAQIGQLGDPTSFTLTKKLAQGSLTIYVYTATFASVTLSEIFVLDQNDKIAGLLLKPQ
ncbi:MAG TPA: hypothetical protein VEW74_06710 [Candidatus Nitrosotalea sp.]|nr:hypothetical protein [Candidatus Nitrosotalea sp.]